MQRKNEVPELIEFIFGNKNDKLLRAAFFVGELNLIGFRTIVAVTVVSPAVVDLEVKLVLVVLKVNQDGQIFSDFDRVLQWGSL